MDKFNDFVIVNEKTIQRLETVQRSMLVTKPERLQLTNIA